MEGPVYRSRTERVIAGVCGGIALHYGWDPTVVRLAAVGLGLISGGAAVVAYVVAALLMPEEPVGAGSSGAPVWGAPRTPYGDSSAAPVMPMIEPGAEPLMPEQGMGPGDMPEPGEYGHAEPGEYGQPQTAPPEAAPDGEGAHEAAHAPGAVPPDATSQQTPPPQQPPHSPRGSVASHWAVSHQQPYTPVYGPLRRRRGGIVGGTILIAIGLLLLAGQFLAIDYGRLWPLIIIIVGIALIFGRSGRD